MRFIEALAAKKQVCSHAMQPAIQCRISLEKGNSQ
jgi:hypothetical protein